MGIEWGETDVRRTRIMASFALENSKTARGGNIKEGTERHVHGGKEYRSRVQG